MADEEQLHILREEGIEAWNRWRRKHWDIRPDLSKAYLCVADLCEANLYEANLHEANLRDALLSGADLRRADLGGAHLSEADLSRADLTKADLSGAHLWLASLSRADLTEANLQGAHLTRAVLSDAHLRGAHLRGIDFRETHLNGADLSGADLREAHLGTRLFYVNFGEAELSGADLSGAWIGGTMFGAVDLSDVKGLESVVYSGPSTIGIDTVYRSRGRIPEAFLRGCGVPEGLITYMRSLVGRPIEYYSCFISYSSKDQAFADRLHADLQAKGVRCWFAPEDMQIGEKIWERLDQSIRRLDKLLVILSGNSIGSTWVEDEVMTAFEEERKRHQTVLFPVRLDDAVLASGEAWAGLVRQRHIGDFRGWKEHDAYRVAFERLMRDLKAG